jgi:hypothetical protein
VADRGSDEEEEDAVYQQTVHPHPKKSTGHGVFGDGPTGG